MLHCGTPSCFYCEMCCLSHNFGCCAATVAVVGYNDVDAWMWHGTWDSQGVIEGDAVNCFASSHVVDSGDYAILLGCCLVDGQWVNDKLVAFGFQLWGAILRRGYHQLQCREINR